MRSEFLRFPPEAVEFLAALRKHNSRDWFEVHAKEYDDVLLTPAKRFVEAAGNELRKFISDIHAEPRVLGSIFRINHDTRYGRHDQPYKDHLDFYFWQGERKHAVSGLFMRLSPDFVGIGAGCHGFEPEELQLFRQALTIPKIAAALVALASKVESQGYKIRGEYYKRVPKNLATIDEARRFLQFKALYVHANEPAEIAVKEGALLSACIRHWRRLADMQRWITDHVQNAAKD